MSPAVRLFRQRLERRAAALAPDLRAALFRAFADLRGQLSVTQLETFLRSAQAERIFSDLLTDTAINKAFLRPRLVLRNGVEQAGRAIAKELPRAAKGVLFDVLNPKVLEAIQTLNTRVMVTLQDEIREAVRAAVAQGLRDGTPPATIARGLRDLIGLAPNQVEAVANFRRMLETGDRAALTRALRDRRFDRAIRTAFGGAGLTPAQIDRMVDVYQKRFVAFHAETVTRTAALDAQRLGQHLTWEAAVDRGDIDGTTLTKRWSGVLDDRERPSHLAMEGETVRWDQPYSNGQMVPGDDEYNCRCVSIYETTGTIKAGAGARGVDLNRLRVAGLL